MISESKIELKGLSGIGWSGLALLNIPASERFYFVLSCSLLGASTSNRIGLIES